ncbi:HNH endonuclease signature motif containing protein [Vallitalea maricola]|uniref:Uncharacterized protein n=1 Tax=Vallitalea maricola TaxID=3074433 RepID=A0ACB5URK6_9FIRM|nr:hypothetical protein AN2V17_38410 [Vallitalea sp. AN17-2]
MKSIGSNRTIKALIARGLDSKLAIDLYQKGYTLNKLKCTPIAELSNLGIINEVAIRIHKESRAPIPFNTVNKLLFDSRYTCCVCRDKSRPIVIHHIIPWEESRSDDIENLVVLCQKHHDDAHTKHDLSINLTSNKIVELKKEWNSKVRELDKDVVLKSMEPKEWYEAMSMCWDYFNVTRIYELAENLGIDMVDGNKYFLSLYRQGYVDKNGMLLANEISKQVAADSLYWLDFMGGTYISFFFKEILKMIIDSREVLILNDLWTKPQIMSVVKPGAILFLQGAFYFRHLSKEHRGKNQNRIGYRQAKGIKLEFQFNPWHCVSGSSHYNHLTGRRVATVIGIARAVTNVNGQVNIRCSVLGIGTGFDNVINGRFAFYSPTDFEDYEEDELYIEI